ncbi:MAG TPA: hypothetical protein VKA95_06045 [Nitrososphaeraceae archaeon]|nr:hypothetical protein [Nitrososphaeraceae archaeon]
MDSTSRYTLMVLVFSLFVLSISFLFQEEAVGTSSNQTKNASANIKENGDSENDSADDVNTSLIAALGSIAAAALAGYFGIINQTKLKKLEREKAEQDARRAYEYNALKRLYEECEPILFQFYELSEIAYERILHMPSRAKQGKLRYIADATKRSKEAYQSESAEEAYQSESADHGHRKSEGWLSGPGYYMISTIYNLLAPLAAFKLLQNSQNRLTRVDLSVDPSIETIYLLANRLYRTFSADVALADSDPKIPNYKGFEQGIFAHYLDNMTEALIEYYYEPDKTPRLKSFGKFTGEYIKVKIKTEKVNGKTEVRKKVKVLHPFNLIYNILLNFHPMAKPVLWRILIAQLYLYNAIRNVYDRNPTEVDFKPIKTIPELLQKPEEMDWRIASEASDSKVLVNPFKAVEKYLSSDTKLRKFTCFRRPDYSSSI